MKKGNIGFLILAGMLAVGLLIFGFAMMQERNRAEDTLAVKSDDMMASQQEKDAVIAVQKQQLQELENQLQNAQGSSAETEAANALLLEELSQVQGTLDDTKQVLTGVAQERDGLQEQLEQATQEKADIQGQLEQATQEKAAVQSQLEQVTQEKADIQGQLEQVTQEKADIQGQLEQATQEKADVLGQLEQVTQENADVQGQLEQVAQEKADIQGQLEQATQEKADIQGQLEQVAQEKAAVQSQLEQVAQEKAEVQGQLEQVTQEKADAQGQLEQVTQEKADIQGQLEQVTWERDAALCVIAEANKNLTVPVGAWVMEPYAFRLPEYLMMQQDQAGNLYFYFDEAGSVLSCQLEQNPFYLDNQAVLDMYRNRSRQMAERLLPSGVQVQEGIHILSDGQGMLTRYLCPDVTIYLLQYCHDGLNTFVATYTDCGNQPALSAEIMETLFQTMMYLPDEME